MSNESAPEFRPLEWSAAISPTELVQAHGSGLISRGELFVSLAALAAREPPDPLTAALPPELREDFVAWMAEFVAGDSELFVFSSAVGKLRFPERALAALRASFLPR